MTNFIIELSVSKDGATKVVEVTLAETSSYAAKARASITTQYENPFARVAVVDCKAVA